MRTSIIEHLMLVALAILFIPNVGGIGLSFSHQNAASSEVSYASTLDPDSSISEVITANSENFNLDVSGSGDYSFSKSVSNAEGDYVLTTADIKGKSASWSYSYDLNPYSSYAIGTEDLTVHHASTIFASTNSWNREGDSTYASTFVADDLGRNSAYLEGYHNLGYADSSNAYVFQKADSSSGTSIYFDEYAGTGDKWAHSWSGATGNSNQNYVNGKFNGDAASVSGKESLVRVNDLSVSAPNGNAIAQVEAGRGWSDVLSNYKSYSSAVEKVSNGNLNSYSGIANVDDDSSEVLQSLPTSQANSISTSVSASNRESDAAVLGLTVRSNANDQTAVIGNYWIYGAASDYYAFAYHQFDQAQADFILANTMGQINYGAEASVTQFQAGNLHMVQPRDKLPIEGGYQSWSLAANNAAAVTELNAGYLVAPAEAGSGLVDAWAINPYGLTFADTMFANNGKISMNPNTLPTFSYADQTGTYSQTCAIAGGHYTQADALAYSAVANDWMKDTKSGSIKAYYYGTVAYTSVFPRDRQALTIQD